jgi:hypothetical protein
MILELKEKIYFYVYLLGKGSTNKYWIHWVPVVMSDDSAAWENVLALNGVDECYDCFRNFTKTVSTIFMRPRKIVSHDKLWLKWWLWKDTHTPEFYVSVNFSQFLSDGSRSLLNIASLRFPRGILRSFSEFQNQRGFFSKTKIIYSDLSAAN